MTSHFAADLAKNAHLRTEVFSDLSLITAISNDMGYKWVFAEPLRRRAKKGDMLVAITAPVLPRTFFLCCRSCPEKGFGNCDPFRHFFRKSA